MAAGIPASQQTGPAHVLEQREGRNVEIKARDVVPERTLEACRKLGAVDCGLLWQRDTYFNASLGRLKLREQRPGRSQLIHYERAEGADQRESRYRILEVGEAEPIRDFLAGSLGVHATVTKRRRLFLWRSVRIHLDDVEGQGKFIEFEAVAPPDSDLTAEHELITELRTRLAVPDDSLIAESYASLVAAAHAAASNPAVTALDSR